MEKVDYLEVDNPIPGQNYTCISFVSPDETMKQKELFLFNKFMNQRCGELENNLSEIIKKCSDELKNKIQRDIVDKLKLELKYTYDQFKNKYDDFKYKFNDELNTAFNFKKSLLSFHDISIISFFIFFVSTSFNLLFFGRLSLVACQLFCAFHILSACIATGCLFDTSNELNATSTCKSMEDNAIILNNNGKQIVKQRDMHG